MGHLLSHRCAIVWTPRDEGFPRKTSGLSAVAETTQPDRLLDLLRMLGYRQQGASLRDLAAEYGCNQKTIRRDLAVLRRVGFPLEEIPGPHGRKNWRLDASRPVPQLSFTLTEALSLYLGRRLLEPLAGTYVWDGAQTAFRKIRACLSPAALAHIDEIGATFFQTTLGLGNYTARGQALDALMIGIEDRTVTRIAYHSLRNKAPQEYNIHPYGLVYHKGALYLIAWSAHHGELRHFKVDRIQSAASDNADKFDRPADFDLAAHLSDSFGVFHSTGPKQTVRIRFAPSVARHIQERRWHPSQKVTEEQDGTLLTEFELSDLHEVKAWVLSFGAKAVVESPPELRREIESETHQMWKNYKART